MSRGARSYFTYGQIIFRAATHIFRGRWHLDSENSFFLGETGLEGLLELARLTRIPVQQLARASIGTGITSVQLEAAHRMGFLIPWRKHRPEEFKAAVQAGKHVFMEKPIAVDTWGCRQVLQDGEKARANKRGTMLDSAPHHKRPQGPPSRRGS
jgi:hypothetical protein